MPKGIFIRTEEHKRNLGLAHRGKKLSEEHKRNLRLSHLGKKHSKETCLKRSESLKRIGHKPPSWKNKHHTEISKLKMSLANKGRKLSDEHRRNIGLAHKGKKVSGNRKLGWKLSDETRRKIGLTSKGRQFSEEHRRKIGLAHKGEKSHWWKGGLTLLKDKIRNTFKYRLWRETVFKRDNWICVWCGIRGGKLEADHIIAFSVLLRKYLIKTLEQALLCQELWNINNGRTLCIKCHEKTDTYGGKSISKKIKL